uniref:Uncharacterized protein n=1 Tax=Siphoviridae sp. ct0uL16 TaxID=2825299 RepID=A0A8S5Q4L8_9CAUD|nr:MAG TPA: hypothetical protein [Siphoviridae sp. ct0uL16]
MKRRNMPKGCALVIFVICVVINLVCLYLIAKSVIQLLALDMHLWINFEF